MTAYEFIKQQNIFTCRACPDIIQLQLDRDINVCPLFWQGEGGGNIPLVIMGGNPSVVGTPNEPSCGERDFDYYFDYYQNRTESERINQMQALARGIRIPLRHWTMCHNLARILIAAPEMQRWKNYVLMEAIHCFYNRENDLNSVQRASVASSCFNRHTLDMLLFLKPKMIVLLGDMPYRLLQQLGYLSELDVCNFCKMKIKGEIDGKSITLTIPVMRHRAPNFRGRFYCDDNVYNAFREFAGFNGGQP